MENSLTALSDRLAEAVERAGRFVAGVEARPRIGSSGVLWQPGVVVTAHHTIRTPDEIQVILPDGATARADLAGRDPGTDLAVLRIEGAATASPPSAAADKIAAGRLALVVGRARTPGVTAQFGVIGAAAGAWNTWRGGRLDRLVRLDIDLHPASAGGAVVDAEGALIGMATGGLTRLAPIAVPVSTIARVVRVLLESGHMRRGYLGVGLQSVALPEEWRKAAGGHASGLMLMSVEPASPAHAAGLTIGDVLLEIGGVAATDPADVLGVLAKEPVGAALDVVLLSKGARREVKVTLGERSGSE